MKNDVASNRNEQQGASGTPFCIDGHSPSLTYFLLAEGSRYPLSRFHWLTSNSFATEQAFDDSHRGGFLTSVLGHAQWNFVKRIHALAEHPGGHIEYQFLTVSSSIPPLTLMGTSLTVTNGGCRAAGAAGPQWVFELSPRGADL